MSDDDLQTLERLWDDLDAGPVPLDSLLAGGPRQVRRRRRRLLAAAAASVALVVGASLLAQGLPGRTERDAQPASATELRTTVRSGVIGEVNASVDVFSGPAAVWDTSSSSLLYVTGYGYSSTCLPTAHAHTSPGGRIVLEVDRHAGRDICTADAVRATVRIGGIHEPPLVITVISDGKAADVMVQNRAPVVRPGRPNKALEVGESGPMVVALHCGLEFVQMGDQAWRTFGAASSTSGLSEVLVGTGTRTATDTLVFTSAQYDGPIVFHPARRTKPYVCY